MKNSIFTNYITFRLNSIYSYFSIIWESLEPKIKLSKKNKRIVYKVIEYILAKKEFKELYEKNKLSEQLVIETTSLIVKKETFLPLIECAINISKISCNLKSELSSLQAISKAKSTLEKYYDKGQLAYLKKKEKELRVAFANERKILKKFSEKSTNQIFNVDMIPLFGVDLSLTTMFDTKLKWKIKGLEKETLENTQKVLDKYGIQDNLTFIALYEVELALLKSLNGKKYISAIFIDINDKFFKNKKNIKELKKVAVHDYIKSKINFRISYKVLDEFQKEIRLLKNEGFNFSLNEMVDDEIKELNSYISYTFEEFDRIKDPEKSKTYCKNNNIKVVITNVNDSEKVSFCQKEIGDYFRRF